MQIVSEGHILQKQTKVIETSKEAKHTNIKTELMFVFPITQKPCPPKNTKTVRISKYNLL
jgi:hypothetical protein